MRNYLYKTALVFTAALMLQAFVMPASAQENLPEVEIDTSVLEELGKFDKDLNNAPAQQPVLQRPVVTPAKPTLTAPDGDIKAFPIKEKPINRETINPSASQSRQIIKPVEPVYQQPVYTPPPVYQPPIAAPAQEAVYRPTPSPVYDDIPLPKRKPQKPVKAAAKKEAPAVDKTVVQKAVVEAPIPTRRPVKQQASESFVAEARKKAAAQGVPTMPAVPKGRVYAETLAKKSSISGGTNDPFEQDIVNLSRQEVLDTVEAVSNQIEARDGVKQEKKTISPVKMPELPKAPTTKMPPATKIIKADIRDPAPPTAKEEELKVASLPDDTGETDVIDITEEPEEDDSMVPRPPPTLSGYEEEFITLAFSKGYSDIDDEIKKELNSDVVPLLKKNPDWRIQIQSFASATDKGLSSARRVSLSRGLAIRSYLLEQGIEARRMDVRALGMQTDRTPLDRADLVFFDPDEVP